MEAQSPEGSPNQPLGEDSSDGSPRERRPLATYVVFVTVILTPALVGIGLTVKAKLDKAVADANAARTELAVRDQRDRAQQAQLASLKRQFEQTQATVREDAQRLRGLSSSDETLSAELQSTGEAVGRLRDELSHFVDNVGCCPDGGPPSSPAESGADSTEARSADACAPPMDAFEDLAREGGTTALRQGDFAVLRIPSAVLFEAGGTSIGATGRKLLVRLASALENTRWDGSLRVAAYTDERPIQGRLDASWQLTATQAAHVVELLAAQGIPARALSATGYGASAATGEDSTSGEHPESRRIEIWTSVPPTCVGAAANTGRDE